MKNQVHCSNDLGSVKVIMSYFRFLFMILISVQSACQHNPGGEKFSEAQLDQLRVEIKKAVKQSERKPHSKDTALKISQKTDQKKVKKEVLKKIVIGRVEWIGTLSPKIDFRARIDTGAQSCSMHAENIKEKKVEGERYVEFTTFDEEGRAFTLLKKVIKTSMVKGTSGVAEKRYVVKMKLSFGQRQPLVNVNLNNRKNLKHKFLVGRNLLLRDYIVDVTQSRLLGGKE